MRLASGIVSGVRDEHRHAGDGRGLDADAEPRFDLAENRERPGAALLLERAPSLRIAGDDVPAGGERGADGRPRRCADRVRHRQQPRRNLASFKPGRAGLGVAGPGASSGAASVGASVGRAPPARRFRRLNQLAVVMRLSVLSFRSGRRSAGRLPRHQHVAARLAAIVGIGRVHGGVEIGHLDPDRRIL